MRDPPHPVMAGLVPAIHVRAALFVMAGPVPAIHVCLRRRGAKTWMPGSGPGMTAEGVNERTPPGFAPSPSPVCDRLALCESALPAGGERWGACLQPGSTRTNEAPNPLS